MADDKPHGKAAIMQAVIDAAIPLIASKGVLAVSIRDIATAANVNSALIIRHFGSKELMLNKIGDYLGDKTLRSAQDKQRSLDETWESIITDRNLELRAMARILLDTEPNRDLKATSAILAQARSWFQRELKLPEGQGNDSALAVYISACLVIGSEVVGSHVLKAMGIDVAQANSLRLQAFRLVLETVARRAQESAPIGHKPK